MANKFSSAFTEDTLINGTPTTIADSYVMLGQYKVQAGEGIVVGKGDYDGQANAQGRIYCDLKDSADANVEGMVQLIAYTPQDHPIEVMGEWRTETLRTNLNDRSLQIPLPAMKGQGLKEDRRLKLMFKADENGDVSQANSTLLMDITKHLTN